jgi:hypothetical protein
MELHNNKLDGFLFSFNIFSILQQNSPFYRNSRMINRFVVVVVFLSEFWNAQSMEIK